MTAIGTYIRFLLPNGTQTPYAFQNFHSGEVRSYEGHNYQYASFGFSGSTVDLQGANITASLVFAISPLLLNFIQEAADGRWVVQIKTVWLNPDSFDETGVFTEDVFQLTGFQQDTLRLSLVLGSPLDAVERQFPQRVLTQFLVGSLPTTGQIAFS